MPKPASSDSTARQVIANVLTLFTRRPFTVLIPILVGALIAPVLAEIGFGAQAAGILALIVIIVLVIVLSSAWVRRVCVMVWKRLFAARRTRQ